MLNFQGATSSFIFSVIIIGTSHWAQNVSLLKSVVLRDSLGTQHFVRCAKTCFPRESKQFC
jgi:hypothetical protein